MSEIRKEKYIAEIDTSGLPPEFLSEFEGRLSSKGPTPEAAIATLRGHLGEALQRQGAFVLEGSVFTPAEKELVKAFRKKGPEDPEVIEMYNQWSITQEELIHSIDTSEALIAFERRRAVLLWNGGLQNHAAEAFEDALRIAQQEEKHDLFKEILDELNDFLGD